ncbi:hypothetical protein [Luteolibacter soli]|uniref:Calx-beta domain-containing protein n=1 Tax=Luteolibacter soli TaxID=3135280 RepID=A0ABU9AQR1_9BACT
MKVPPAFLLLLLLLLAAPASAQQGPKITSFLKTGELTCIQLEPGSTATIERSSSLAPASWTDWTSLPVDPDGVIQATVPVSGVRGFFRVRGTPMPSIVVTVTSLGINEAGSGTFGVRLGYQPAATTTVTLGSSDTSSATASPSSLTFTTANWNILQTVTINGVADADATNESVTVTVSSTGLTSRTVDVTVTDDDVLGIETSTASVTLGEAGSTTFGVRLTAQPPATTTVTVGSSDTSAATASPSSLTFTTTNWATLQTVTVNGVADEDLLNESVTITLSSAGLGSQTVTATVTDDDTQALITSPTSITISEAGSGTSGVRLAFQPSSNVTVSLGSSDTTAATVSPSILTFTPANYATPQTITVNGVADIDLLNESVTITASAPGATSGTVNVTVTDDDTQSVIISPTSITISEAGSGTSGVRLAFQPSSNVTVSLGSSDTGAATVSPPTLTFTPVNYATPQTITVSGVADIDLLNESVTITASAPGATSGTVGVTVTDDDVQDILTSSPSLTIGEAGSGTFTVRLAFQPAANVTVNVGSSDTGAATVSPTSLTFTPANYAISQTVTVNGVNDPDLLNESPTVSLTASGLTTRSVAVTVLDDD